MKTITTTFIALITSMFFATSAIAAICGGTPCVDSADIIDGSLLSRDLAPNTVSGVQIRNGAIFTNKIAPGAVTPAKISAAGTATGDVLTADGAGNANWQPSGGGSASYVRTVVVSPVLVGGVPDAVQSGTALLAALTGITTASATDPYLLKIEPGVYDLGAQSLGMKPYVDIEGSGEMTTTITSTIASTTAGTVIGVDNVELRFITVQNTGGGANAIAILSNGASPRLTHVTATASGGIANGVYNNNSSPTMTNMMVTASGGSTNYGMYNVNNSSPTMANVTVTASGGSTNLGVLYTSTAPASPVVIRNSTISGTTSSVTTPAGWTVNIYSSTLTGLTNGAGTTQCVGVSETTGGTFTAALAACP